MPTANTTTKLVMTFRNFSGEEVVYFFDYIDPETTTQQVTTLMIAMIENGDIYQSAPATIKGAKLVSTEETELEVTA